MRQLTILLVLVVCSACFDAVPQGDGGTGGGSGNDGGAGGGGVGGGTGGGTIAPCANLPAEQCEARSDCEPIYCQSCSCNRSLLQCKGPNDVEVSCPLLGCPQLLCCNDEADCTSSSLICVPPDSRAGCGACNPESGNCQTDSECIGTQICEPVPCACSGGSKRCTPGCSTNTDCPDGESCNSSNHRCEAKLCNTVTDCPVSFACLSGVCSRKTCNLDTDCSSRGGSSCVKSFCYSGQGQCLGSAP